MKGWMFLYTAILFEVLGTTSMKFSAGFSRLVPSVLIFIFYGISFTFLTLSLKSLNLSLAYAIWAGLGTALIAVIGVFVFHEPMSVIKLLCLLMIITGVIGLKLSST